MNNITIPKKAMNIALRKGLNYKQIENNIEKFADVMQDHYPHLSRNECYDIKLKLTNRQINLGWDKEYLLKLKKEMFEKYKQYQHYKKFSKLEEMNSIEYQYISIDKKTYNRVVDELREIGINEQYAPNNINDVKSFVYSLSSSDVEAVIITIVAFAIVIGVFFWDEIVRLVS